MEFTDTEKPETTTDSLRKIESAHDFDQLYQMDHLKLSETITHLAGASTEPTSQTLSSAQTAPTEQTSDTQYDPSKIMAGSTYPRASINKTTHKSPPSHTFSECDTSSFSLRVGPNYNKTGTKAPGGPSLYDTVGMDFVRCGSRIDDFASKVNLPEEWTSIDTHVPGVPPLFIVNVQLPEDFSTSFFTTKTDGPGWSLVIFFRISQATADALRDLATAPPAVKLFAQYCQRAPEAGPADAFSTGRFKIILRCEDIEQFGLPSFITSYNSKPVLIRNTGTLVRGARYIEMDINVHKFASLPKRALESMFSRFDKMTFSCGFCVESRTDEEMPENVFGAAQINSPVHQQSPLWKQ